MIQPLNSFRCRFTRCNGFTGTRAQNAGSGSGPDFRLSTTLFRPVQKHIIRFIKVII